MGMNAGMREWATKKDAMDATKEMERFTTSYASVRTRNSTGLHLATASRTRNGET